MAYEQRDYAGAAVQTTLTTGISATDTILIIDDSAGWPSGGAAGPFFVVVDRGLAGEEKIEVQSRTGTTLTVASTLKRGVDGTSAGTHAAGSAIAHTFTAQDAEEANSHITNTGLDHHTQYLNSARHLSVPHTQAMLASDSVGSAQIAAGAVGASELSADAVTTTSILDDAVTSAKIAANAVGASELADASVDTAAIVDANVTEAKLADNSVTAAKLATGAVANTADIVDGIITFAKIASEASTDWSASATFTNPPANLVLGTGGAKYANYYKIGRIVIYWAHFQLGSGGNISSGGQIQLNLPFANTSSHRGFAAAKARQAGGLVASGTAAIGVGASFVTNFVSAGVSASWDATTPFNWDNGDGFDAIIVYEAAA